MNRDRWKLLLSCLLLISGTILSIQGLRILLESEVGQTTAARQFRSAAVLPSKPSAERRPPRGDIMALLTIPRLSTELYVMEGDGNSELRRGPGHLADSAMPGSRGNCVIAGHRDTHFRILHEIRKGDDINVRTNSGTFVYRVDSISVVSPSNTTSLRATNRPVLHLVTCYPFYYVGSAPQRLVVEASLASGPTGELHAKTK
ncbi:MAG: sortase family protein [Candidatus Solibacter sp.]|jgi:sortase A|nr:sortase family protein [Candidatus Solibacter sp.]